MDIFAFLQLLAVTLIKTVLIAGVTFWLSLVIFTLYPPLGRYLAKLLDFDK